MEKLNFSLEPHEEKPTHRTKMGFGPCEVYGCPRDGVINIGVRNCRYHHGKSGSSLAQITMTLRNHSRDFDWYDHLLTRTPVDFLVGDVAKYAPEHLRVLPNENFKTYKDRIKQHIEILLIPKSRLQEVVR